MSTALPVAPAAATGDGLAWRDYVAWLGAQPPAGHPDDLFARYLDHLAAAGVPPRRIADAMDAIAARLDTDSTAWRPVFNNVYQSPAPRYSTQPNEFVAHVAGRARPGTALDIAMGEGRNALFLAAAGWRVTGFDIAEAGLSAARARARAAALDVSAVWCSAQDFCYGVDSWDLIVATYCPQPLEDSGVAPAVVRALRPGGLLLVEALSRTPGAAARGRAAVLDLPGVAAAFPGLDVLHADRTAAAADWCADHPGVVRLLAQRPQQDRRS